MRLFARPLTAVRVLAAALLLTSAAACSGDSDPTAPTQASITGTWTLQTINGTRLPFIVAQTGADKLELTSDVLTVSGTGSFTQTTTLRLTQNGQVTTQSVADAGTYTLNGTAASFRFNSDGSTGTGSISGNTLTVTSEGFALVYTK
jgi:hypothetical protein